MNRPLLASGSVSFNSIAAAQGKSPLAEKLLGSHGISNVTIGRDFVTVTKAEHGDWDLVHKAGSTIIKEHLQSEAPVVIGDIGQAHKGGNTDIESKIREILDAEIRPAVAQDGGDITFERFEGGTVYLYLQGSCSGCPSSAMTLKMGIETRLKAMIPEVQEVVSI